MDYMLELDNGQKFRFYSHEEIMQWMWDNKGEFGSDALIYDIDGAIEKEGKAIIYGFGMNQEWNVGYIKRM